MVTLLAKLFTWIGTFGPVVRIILAVSTVGLTLYSFLSAVWVNLFAEIDSLVLPSMPTGVDFSPLGLLNYVFPVDTLCTYVTALLALKLACTGIRIVKSFIPTVA